jgi:hypothetical protein
LRFIEGLNVGHSGFPPSCRKNIFYNVANYIMLQLNSQVM